MNAHSFHNLSHVIHKLARLYDDDQLEALLRRYGADCRSLPSDGSQLGARGWSLGREAIPK
jgi:hypothetical protein